VSCGEKIFPLIPQKSPVSEGEKIIPQICADLREKILPAEKKLLNHFRFSPPDAYIPEKSC
jgi:hypothetical protein